MSPMKEQIFDNYCTKKQWLNIAPTLAQQLLLVDEIMRAGKGMGGGGNRMGPWYIISWIVLIFFCNYIIKEVLYLIFECLLILYPLPIIF